MIKNNSIIRNNNPLEKDIYRKHYNMFVSIIKKKNVYLHFGCHVH